MTLFMRGCISQTAYEGYPYGIEKMMDNDKEILDEE